MKIMGKGKLIPPYEYKGYWEKGKGLKYISKLRFLRRGPVGKNIKLYPSEKKSRCSLYGRRGGRGVELEDLMTDDETSDEEEGINEKTICQDDSDDSLSEDNAAEVARSVHH